MEGHVTLAQRHFPSWGHSDSGRTLCSVLEESHALGRTGKKREGPVAPVSWAAASQLKIRGIEAERKHLGLKLKRGGSQKKWRKTPEANHSTGWEIRYSALLSLFSKKTEARE